MLTKDSSSVCVHDCFALHTCFLYCCSFASLQFTYQGDFFLFFLNSATEKSYSAVSRENTSWIKFEVIFGCTFFPLRTAACAYKFNQPALPSLLPECTDSLQQCHLPRVLPHMRMCRGNSPCRPSTETTCIPSHCYSLHAASCLQTPLVVTSWLSWPLVCGTLLSAWRCLTLTPMLLSDLNIRWWWKRGKRVQRLYKGMRYRFSFGWIDPVLKISPREVCS